jgi:hypothetical protein
LTSKVCGGLNDAACGSGGRRSRLAELSRHSRARCNPSYSPHILSPTLHDKSDTVCLGCSATNRATKANSVSCITCSSANKPHGNSCIEPHRADAKLSTTNDNSECLGELGGWSEGRSCYNVKHDLHRRRLECRSGKVTMEVYQCSDPQLWFLQRETASVVILHRPYHPHDVRPP